MLELMPAVVSFGAGLALVLFFAEQFVKGAVGTSVGFRVSALLCIVRVSNNSVQCAAQS